jgi:hypothetical protein
MQSVKPASTSHAKALGRAECRDVSEMLQDIDSIELSLGVQHVRLRGRLSPVRFVA